MCKYHGTLEEILQTMHDSEYFSRGRRDLNSRFWTTYERIAKQSDEDFLERYNGDLDVQLIFVRSLRGILPFFLY